MKTLIIILFPFICFTQQMELLKDLDTSSNLLSMATSARINGYKTKFDSEGFFFTDKKSFVEVDEDGDFLYYAPYSTEEYLSLKKKLDQEYELVQSNYYSDSKDTEIMYIESSRLIWHLMIFNEDGEKLIALALESK
jgi:hypothetical protein